MSGLIRQQRVDKNGKVNTKLVRADAKAGASGKVLPPPSLKQSKADLAATQEKRWRINPDSWTCDKELAAIVKQMTTPRQTFHCSDNEVYDVLSVVEPWDLKPLLAIGFREGDKTRTFLEETGVGRLVADNEELAKEASRRRIPAQSFIDFLEENSYFRNTPEFMDAAEANHLMPTAPKGVPAAKRVLDGKLNLDDIKFIGAPRLTRTGISSTHYGNAGLDQLEMIKDGTSKYDLKTMKKLLTHASGHGMVDGHVLRLANDYGADTMLAIKDVVSARFLEETLGNTGYSVKHRGELLLFADRIREKTETPPSRTQLFQLYNGYHEADMDIDEILDAYDKGLTADQAIAVREGVITPAVADGYL